MLPLISSNWHRLTTAGDAPLPFVHRCNWSLSNFFSVFLKQRKSKRKSPNPSAWRKVYPLASDGKEARSLIIFSSLRTGSEENIASFGHRDSLLSVFSGAEPVSHGFVQYDGKWDAFWIMHPRTGCQNWRKMLFSRKELEQTALYLRVRGNKMFQWSSKNVGAWYFETPRQHMPEWLKTTGWFLLRLRGTTTTTTNKTNKQTNKKNQTIKTASLLIQCSFLVFARIDLSNCGLTDLDVFQQDDMWGGTTKYRKEDLVFL